MARPFHFSVNEVFRMKAEHFSFKMKVLARYSLRNSCAKGTLRTHAMLVKLAYSTGQFPIYEAIIKFSVYFQNVRQIKIVSFLFAKRRP